MSKKSDENTSKPWSSQVLWLAMPFTSALAGLMLYTVLEAVHPTKRGLLYQMCRTRTVQLAQQDLQRVQQ